MNIDAILEILKLGAGPSVAVVCIFWLRYAIKERNFWRNKYLDSKESEEKKLHERKIEQKNTIKILQKMLEDKNE